MVLSINELEKWIKQDLDQKRYFTKQSWCKPSRFDAGQKVYDVVIIGAGQCGLALAHNLKMRGIGRILVLDKQPLDKPGPWSTFARMPALRTPKNIPAMESGNPLLSFRTWYCAQYSEAAYDSFDYIPTENWKEYLAWFRKVLEIDVINEYEVAELESQTDADCFKIIPRQGDGQQVYFSKFVCLATGMTASGAWHMPEEYVGLLPEHRIHCAWDDIDFRKFEGRRVAVIGSGAAAFDNASASIEHSCSQLTMFSRRIFPKGEGVSTILARGRNDALIFDEESGQAPADILQPVLDYNQYLQPQDRAKLLALFFKDGRSAPRPEYFANIKHIEKINILEGEKISDLRLNSREEIELISNEKAHLFDELIIATGPQYNLELRPELKHFHQDILTWKDVIFDENVLSLGVQPILSESYQFRSKHGDSEEVISRLYSMSDVVLSTVGIQCVAKVSQIIAEDISKRLFHSSFDHIMDFIQDEENYQTN
ncbi:NAD(P)/FAD-dependent oxidoreductase [Pseudoalteromonas sp. JBTF-M23]|uniref:NAD(P)/FAD-dependent oxidoreductase n=1 Tax=Pseudoalteromonas caenipelagi TaxID=2726988 RepID=A0A849VM23_9GAMM|nr:NAD(P)/FAD-dependent oxidoreductase [Pseudoalteromonas caenipelagi]NOU52637.1 NAD(P)/FAD-dependent oxidoreductase [Pseudoalteromonas caenipelagi]